jgi:hypothetical protein
MDTVDTATAATTDADTATIPAIPKARKPRFFVINGEVLPDPVPGQPVEAALAAFDLSFPGAGRATLTEYEEGARVLLEVNIQARVGTKGLPAEADDHGRLLARLGALSTYRPALLAFLPLLTMPDGDELDARLLDPACEEALANGEREVRGIDTLVSRLAALFR